MRRAQWGLVASVLAALAGLAFGLWAGISIARAGPDEPPLPPPSAQRPPVAS